MTFDPLDQELNWAIEHAGVAATVLLSLWIVFGLFTLWWAVGVILFTLIIILKETIYDPHYEANNPFLPDGAMDLCEYFIGYAFVVFLWTVTTLR